MPAVLFTLCPRRTRVRAGYRGVTVTMADVAHPLTRRAEHLDAPSRGPDEDSRDGPGGADPYRNGRGVTNLGNSVPLSLRAKSPRSHPYTDHAERTWRWARAPSLACYSYGFRPQRVQEQRLMITLHSVRCSSRFRSRLVSLTSLIMFQLPLTTACSPPYHAARHTPRTRPGSSSSLHPKVAPDPPLA